MVSYFGADGIDINDATFSDEAIDNGEKEDRTLIYNINDME